MVQIKSGHNIRYLWLAAAIFWMMLIFWFSGQKASESGEISGTLTYHIAKGINQVFQLDWEEEALLQYAGRLDHPVRKAAHMTEYAILAWIFLGNCMQYSILQKRKFLWAGIFASVYAASDEFHQLFIEGRSGELKDVAIDSMGAVIGLLLAWLLLHKVKKGCR